MTEEAQVTTVTEYYREVSFDTIDLGVFLVLLLVIVGLFLRKIEWKWGIAAVAATAGAEIFRKLLGLF